MVSGTGKILEGILGSGGSVAIQADLDGVGGANDRIIITPPADRPVLSRGELESGYTIHVGFNGSHPIWLKSVPSGPQWRLGNARFEPDAKKLTLFFDRPTVRQTKESGPPLCGLPSQMLDRDSDGNPNNIEVEVLLEGLQRYQNLTWTEYTTNGSETIESLAVLQGMTDHGEFFELFLRGNTDEGKNVLSDTAQKILQLKGPDGKFKPGTKLWLPSIRE